MEWTYHNVGVAAVGLLLVLVFIASVAVIASWIVRLGDGAGTQRRRAWPKPSPRTPRDVTASPLASQPFPYYTVTSHVPFGATPCPHCGHPLPTEKRED